MHSEDIILGTLDNLINEIDEDLALAWLVENFGSAIGSILMNDRLPRRAREELMTEILGSLREHGVYDLKYDLL